MNSGIYTLTSAMIAQEQKLTATANNLSNVASDGFKRMIRSVQESRASGSARFSGDPLAGAVNATVTLGPSRVDLTSGRIIQTSDPLDVAIDGEGLLVVQAPGVTAYTRAGHLSTLGGLLSTRDGYPLLGEEGPIAVLPGELVIAADGTVTFGGERAGRLRIEVLDPTLLEPMGASLYSSPSPGRPAGPATSLVQGKIEESTVRPMEEMTALIESQRAFELYQRALNTTLNEVNRLTVDDLGATS